MKYLLLTWSNEEEWRLLPPQQQEDAVRRIEAWYREHAQAGRIVQGARLADKAAVQTIQLGPAGKSNPPIRTDGPLRAGAESVGSYTIVEADSMKAAVEVAEAWPAGGAVEVRPFFE